MISEVFFRLKDKKTSIFSVPLTSAAIEVLHYPSACGSERIENTVSKTEKDQLLQLNI
jgi:hypothetical protein